MTCESGILKSPFDSFLRSLRKKTTVESRFFEFPREKKTGSRNRKFEKSGVREIEGASTEIKSKGNGVWFELSGGSRNRGRSKNRDSIVLTAVIYLQKENK